MSDDDVTPTPQLTPDELLLELMDLLALAFPEPVQTTTVTFVASPDGARPCLTDLDARARAGGVPRPDLGHQDHAILDAINALLGDLADATERKAGLRVVHGRLIFAAGADGACDVQLVQAGGAAADDRVKMTRRFDGSELRWLFFTPALFQALEATRDAELAQQDDLVDLLHGYGRFEIDMQKGRVRFQSERKEPLSVPFELLGSWSERSARFLWGWANESIRPELKQGVERLRAASTQAGLRAFTEADFGCPEAMAQRLARHAAAVSGARGLYRAPFRSEVTQGFMYMALRPDV